MWKTRFIKLGHLLRHFQQVKVFDVEDDDDCPDPGPPDHDPLVVVQLGRGLPTSVRQTGRQLRCEADNGLTARLHGRLDGKVCSVEVNKSDIVGVGGCHTGAGGCPDVGEVSREVGEERSRPVWEGVEELRLWRLVEQQTQRGVDGVIDNQMSAGLLVQVDERKDVARTATDQEPSLVRWGWRGGGDGGEAGQQRAGQVVDQQAGEAGGDLRPDQLALLQEQAAAGQGELEVCSVDEGLDSEERLSVQGQVLYAPPHVQHAALLQLEGGQVPRVEVLHPLTEQLSAPLIGVEDVMEAAREQREHLVSLVQDPEEDLVTDLLRSELHQVAVLALPADTGHADWEAEEEVRLHLPPHRPQPLGVQGVGGARAERPAEPHHGLHQAHSLHLLIDLRVWRPEVNHLLLLLSLPRAPAGVEQKQLW